MTMKLTQPQQRLLRLLNGCPSLWACMDNGRNNSDRTLGALTKRGLVVLHKRGVMITGHHVTDAGRSALMEG